jgi:hypothetical protein
MTLISLVMGLMVCVMTKLFPFEGSTVTRAILLAFYTAVGIAVYFGLAYAVKLKQVRMIRRRSP